MCAQIDSGIFYWLIIEMFMLILFSCFHQIFLPIAILSVDFVSVMARFFTDCIPQINLLKYIHDIGGLLNSDVKKQTKI